MYSTMFNVLIQIFEGLLTLNPKMIVEIFLLTTRNRGIDSKRFSSKLLFDTLFFF